MLPGIYQDHKLVGTERTGEGCKTANEMDSLLKLLQFAEYLSRSLLLLDKSSFLRSSLGVLLISSESLSKLISGSSEYYNLNFPVTRFADCTCILEDKVGSILLCQETHLFDMRLEESVEDNFLPYK